MPIDPHHIAHSDLTIEIKPGPELDRAVAEAVGVPMPPWASEPYSPSTNLNAAFAAAEKVGLWVANVLVKLVSSPDAWVVTSGHLFCEAGVRWVSMPGQAATPALAICAAILKLNECSHASRAG